MVAEALWLADRLAWEQAEAMRSGNAFREARLDRLRSFALARCHRRTWAVLASVHEHLRRAHDEARTPRGAR